MKQHSSHPARALGTKTAAPPRVLQPGQVFPGHARHPGSSKALSVPAPGLTRGESHPPSEKATSFSKVSVAGKGALIWRALSATFHRLDALLQPHSRFGHRGRGFRAPTVQHRRQGGSTGFSNRPSKPRGCFKSRGREIFRKSGDLDAGISNPRDAETPERREEPRDPSSPAPGAGGPWARERPRRHRPRPLPPVPPSPRLSVSLPAVHSPSFLAPAPGDYAWISFVPSTPLTRASQFPFLTSSPPPRGAPSWSFACPLPELLRCPPYPLPGFPCPLPAPPPFLNLAPRARVGERPRLSG